MLAAGTVSFWNRAKGWGVIESSDTPGGCWFHFSHLWHQEISLPLGKNEAAEVAGGFRDTREGETVDFEWEPANQDGYGFRAISVWPRGRRAPHDFVRRYRHGDPDAPLQR